jgi:SAM-dependent methyltransferase
MVLADFPKAKDVRGIGLSDSEIYALQLTDRFAYTNTFYHKEPRLDVRTIPSATEGCADFVIASDVFEHVAPPIQPVFNNLFRLLKKGGVCVFSVPYVLEGQTQEHFPELFKYELVQENKKWRLINLTKDGVTQVFENLRFHGGAGTTLEMRVFAETSLRDCLSQAGFENITFHRANEPEHGIIWQDSLSLPITMRRPQ